MKVKAQTKDRIDDILSIQQILEKEMATNSCILAWKVPRTEDPDGLQSMGLQRVRHDLAAEHTYILKTGCSEDSETVSVNISYSIQVHFNRF